jgi:hypothetical protein
MDRFILSHELSPGLCQKLKLMNYEWGLCVIVNEKHLECNIQWKTAVLKSVI